VSNRSIDKSGWGLRERFARDSRQGDERGAGRGFGGATGGVGLGSLGRLGSVTGVCAGLVLAVALVGVPIASYGDEPVTPTSQSGSTAAAVVDDPAAPVVADSPAPVVADSPAEAASISPAGDAAADDPASADGTAPSSSAESAAPAPAAEASAPDPGPAQNPVDPPLASSAAADSDAAAPTDPAISAAVAAPSPDAVLPQVVPNIVPADAPADTPTDAVVPVITSGTVPGGTVGALYSFQLTSNVSPVTFVVSGLPDGLSVDPAVGLIQGIPTTAGTFTVHLEATSPENTTGVTQTYIASVTIDLPPSVVPVITSGPVPGGTVGALYSFQLTSNVSPVTFVVSGLPDGLSVDPQTGLIEGVPTSAGAFEVHLEATSPENTTGVTQTYIASVTIDVPPSVVPVITSGTVPGGTVGAPYSFQLTSNVSPVTFVVSGLPDGLSVDPAVGLIQGVPTTAGTFEVHLEATSPENTTGVTQTYIASVTIDPAAATSLSITSGPLPAGAVGVPYAFQVVASDATAVFVSGGLPDGLSIDAVTGVVSGTPTVVGTFDVAIRAVVWSTVTAVTQHYQLVIDPGNSTREPHITSGAPTAATVGLPYEFQLTASGGQGGLTFTETGLPPGLVLDAATGKISGVPTASGSFLVSFGATGAGIDSDPATYTLTVNEATPPTNPPTEPPATTPSTPPPPAPGASPTSGSGSVTSGSVTSGSATSGGGASSAASVGSSGRGANTASSGSAHRQTELAETGRTDATPVLFGMLGLILIAAGGVAIRARRRRA
jgi:hypothetical protein